MCRRRSRLFQAIVAVVLLGCGRADAFVVNGDSWGHDKTVTEQLSLGSGPTGVVLQDGLGTWDNSAADALATWNKYLQIVSYAWVSGSTVPPQPKDGNNSVFFGSTVFGDAWGSGVLAVTVLWKNGATGLEAESDTIFNSALQWNSYRGPLQGDPRTGTRVYDFHRVALHEFGHTMGLGHPDEAGQVVSALMNSTISDLDHLTDDDIAGVRAVYGGRVFIASTFNPDVLFYADLEQDFRLTVWANFNTTQFSVTGLPQGLVLNTQKGVITGRAEVMGTFDCSVTAIGPRATVSQAFRIIVQPPRFTPMDARVTVGNSLQFPVEFSVPVSSYSVSGLPDGVSFDPVKGVFSGIPTVAGDYVVPVTAHSHWGDFTENFNLVVIPPAFVTLSVPPNLEIGNAFSWAVRVTSPTDSLTVTGLPRGLTFDPTTGLISGVPTVAGTSIVHIVVKTNWGELTADITLKFSPRLITSPATMPSLSIGSGFSYQITADNQPTSFDTSTLPSGLALNRTTGVISGIVTLSGPMSFRVTAHGKFGDATQQVTCDVSPESNAQAPIASLPHIEGTMMVADHVRSRVYITGFSGNLYVIDMHPLRLVKTIAGGSGVDIHMSADSNQLLVAGYSRQILRLDLDTLELLAPISLDFDPTQVVEGLEHRLYVSSNAGVYQLSSDGQTQQTLWSYVSSPVIALSPDRKTLYAAGSINREAERFDVSGAVAALAEHLTELTDVAGRICVSAGGRYVWFAPPAGWQGIPIRLRSAHQLSTVLATTTSSDVAVATDADDAFLYATRSTSTDDGTMASILDCIDLTTLQVRSSVPMATAAALDVALDEQSSSIVVFGGSFVQAYATAKPPPPHTLSNVSTRVSVQSGDTVEIGGFIIGGSAPKRIVVRAVGPSLSALGVNGTLADPVLQLHDSTGAVIATNDNWNYTRQPVVVTGLAPADEHESAIVATLAPGAYTATVAGAGGTGGIGLFELYDVDEQDSRIANLSTRGFVGAGDSAMIGGFIIDGYEPTRVAVRALGPSLSTAGVAGALVDPVLELHNADGTVIAQNDDWSGGDAAAITATGLAPVNPHESAVLMTLAPGSYTAIVRGSGASTGVALFEVYNLQ